MNRATKLIIAILLELIIAVIVTLVLIQNAASKNQVALSNNYYQISAEAIDCSVPSIADQMYKTLPIIQKRLDALGLSGASVEQRGACQLLITTPAIGDQNTLTDVILRVGYLEFVDAENDYFDNGAVIRTTKLPTLTNQTSAFSGTIPAKIYPTLITGADFDPSQFAIQNDTRSQSYSIAFTLRPEAAKLFADFTTLHNEMNSGQRYYLCLVLDNVVQTCPSIRMPIKTASGVITIGEGGLDEANRLVNLLRYGALPVQLKIAQISTVAAASPDEIKRPFIIAGLLIFTAMAVVTLLLFARSRSNDNFADKLDNFKSDQI